MPIIWEFSILKFISPIIYCIRFEYQVAQYSEATLIGINNYGIKDWQGLLYVIPFTVMPTFMMLGAILTCKKTPNERFIGFLTWIILPICLLFLALSWLLCSALGILIVMNAGKNGAHHFVCLKPCDRVYTIFTRLNPHSHLFIVPLSFKIFVLEEESL